MSTSGGCLAASYSGRERSSDARVRAAFFAAFTRFFLPRAEALWRAWRDSAREVAAESPSRCSAFLVARDRFGEGFPRRPLRVESRFAFLRVLAEVFDASGAGSSTPARRAFDRPIAMACFVLRAPCFPSRT